MYEFCDDTDDYELMMRRILVFITNDTNHWLNMLII